MKKALIFLVLLSGVAHAGEESQSDFTISYMDIAITYDAEYINARGTYFPALTYDHTAVMIGFSRRTNEYVSLDFRIGKADSDTATVTGEYEGVYENDLGEVVAANARFRWPLAPWFEPYGLVGFTQWRGDRQLTGRTFGVGVGARFGAFSLRVERQNVVAGRSDTDTNLLILGYAL
ncbi:MAG: hypothetical protein R3217_02660 [Gammaproteobacteria bacterium]|nr:hypothetical protein [Gammaproteobacteria bacterium]